MLRGKKEQHIAKEPTYDKIYCLVLNRDAKPPLEIKVSKQQHSGLNAILAQGHISNANVARQIEERACCHLRTMYVREYEIFVINI